MGRRVFVATVVLATVFGLGVAVGAQNLPMGSDLFEDIPRGHWADEAIGWAVANDITRGTSESRFGPEDPLTRAQFVTMLKRYHDNIAPANAEREETTDSLPPFEERTWELKRYQHSVTLEQTVRANQVVGEYGFSIRCDGGDTLWITVWGKEVPIDSSLDHQTTLWTSYRIGEVGAREPWRFRRIGELYAIWVPEDKLQEIVELFRDRASDLFVTDTDVRGMPDRVGFNLAGWDESVEPVLEACGY